MIVVTGATGHLGNVLVRQLLDRGQYVRAIIYEDESLRSLENLDVEKVPADVCNLDSLLSAFEGADTVYHLAALVSIASGKEAALHAINVRGTENVLQACRAKGVRRLIYSSSSHVFQSSADDTVITEEALIVPSKSPKGYIRSKAQATLKVLDAVRNGLDAVIAVPSGIVGPYDFIPSYMGRMYIEASSAGRAFYIDGGYNFVDVRDVAAGLIAMAEQGVAGEMYLLSGEFFSDRQILDVLIREFKVPPPRYRISPWQAWVMAYCSVFAHKISGGPEPLLSPQAVGEVTGNSSFSCTKAQEQLGFHARSVETSIVDAVRWFRDMEMI